MSTTTENETSVPIERKDVRALLTSSDFYLNLAQIEISEALREISNRRSGGFVVGADYGHARMSLRRAIDALSGHAYEPPPDQKNIVA